MSEEYTNWYLNTEPINKVKAREAVDAMYRVCGLPPPTIEFVKGPFHLRKAIEGNPKAEPLFFEDHNTIASFVSTRGWGKSNRLKAVVSDAFSKGVEGVLPKRKRSFKSNLFLPSRHLFDKEEKYGWPWQQKALELWEQTFGVLSFKDVCYVFERPRAVFHNDRGFHNPKGPAVVFRDDWLCYAFQGEVVSDLLIENKDLVTLADLHQGNSRRHSLIALYGIGRYLELVENFKIDVKGRLKKFLSFGRIDPGPSPSKNDQDYADMMRRHYGEDEHYEVVIRHRKVNGNYCLVLDSDEQLYSWRAFKFPPRAVSSMLFADRADRDLWRLLDPEGAMRRGAHKFMLGYHKGEFYYKNYKYPDSNYPTCHRDVCPSWVKAHMLQGTSCEYEDEISHVKVTDGKFKLLRGPKGTERDALFGGVNAVPSYGFDIDLRSNTWEGLLEKWADLSFKWLHMCEDSRCMP